MEGSRTSKDGLHVLWVFEDDETTYGLKVRNDLRFINHSRRPNVLFDGPDVYTLRVIRPGEELLAHYGHDWKDVD